MLEKLKNYRVKQHYYTPNEIDSKGLKRFTNILNEVHNMTSPIDGWLVNELLELLKIVEVLHFKVLFWAAVLSKGEYNYDGYSASEETCKVKQDGLKVCSGEQF